MKPQITNEFSNTDFCYCERYCCNVKKQCRRYTEGRTLPDGNWWWMTDCGEEKVAFIGNKVTKP